MRLTKKILVLFAVLALVAAACGDDDTTDTTAGPDATTTTTAAPTTTTTTVAGDTTTTVEPMDVTPVVACFVTDDVGVDDRSFNAAGWQGVQDAESAGFASETILLESDDESDYQPNIEQCLAQGAEHIVTNGFKLGAATQQFAELNPDVTWTIVDFSYDPDIPNVRELVYQTDEAAFAAGYLAAGMTKTGIVGTYGGVNIPTVSIFMDGLARGVDYYNDQKGTSVQVIGWRIDDQDGVFTGTFDPGDPTVRDTCESILDEGADIMLPVGGAINNPCGTAIQDRGLDASMIGVDTDAFFAMPAVYQDLWLVTILKGIALQVSNSIQAHAEGTWTPGGDLGTVANGAVGLSEYHAWDDRVPPELRAEVEQILVDIGNGTIDAAVFDVG
jgi:basic membrane protein A